MIDINKYLLSPHTCPYCSGELLTAISRVEFRELDGQETAQQTVECCECRKRWTDVYSLTSVVEMGSDEG